MKRIIINGANGYVGSNFINSLLQDEEYEVIAFVRQGDSSSPRDRMLEALDEMNEGEELNLDNLKVYDYSLSEEDFGLKAEQLEDIFSVDSDYFHFAASLKFNLKSRDEIFQANIDGLKNSLDTFVKHSTPDSRFFFISTAYSCGKFSVLYREKFYDNESIGAFRNYYEQSKRLAENVVKDYIDGQSINGHVLRLSQVVGNNESGITKTDYGIFDFVKRLKRIADKHKNATIRIEVDPEATQNLVPIDLTVHFLMRTVEQKKVPTVMNFVAKNPIKNEDLLDNINNILPITVVPKKYLNKEDLNQLEKTILEGMSFTGSYNSTKIIFDTEQRDKVMQPNGNEATKKSVHKMLDYFLNTYIEEGEKAPAS